jgi:hypothetical protein
MSEPSTITKKLEGVASAADVADGSLASFESDWTVEEETAVRRKFDLTITPLVTLLYMLCAIDRYAHFLDCKILTADLSC